MNWPTRLMRGFNPSWQTNNRGNELVFMERLNEFDDPDQPDEPQSVAHGSPKQPGVDYVRFWLTKRFRIRDKARRSGTKNAIAKTRETRIRCDEMTSANRASIIADHCACEGGAKRWRAQPRIARHRPRNIVHRHLAPPPQLFRTPGRSRDADQDAGQEDQEAADHDLEHGRGQRRVHVPVPDPRNDS